MELDRVSQEPARSGQGSRLAARSTHSHGLTKCAQLRDFSCWHQSGTNCCLATGVLSSHRCENPIGCSKNWVSKYFQKFFPLWVSSDSGVPITVGPMDTASLPVFSLWSTGLTTPEPNKMGKTVLFPAFPALPFLSCLSSSAVYPTICPEMSQLTFT